MALEKRRKEDTSSTTLVAIYTGINEFFTWEKYKHTMDLTQLQEAEIHMPSHAIYEN